MLLKLVKQLSFHDILILEVFNGLFQTLKLIFIFISHQIIVTNRHQLDICLGSSAVVHLLLVKDVDLVHDTP